MSRSFDAYLAISPNELLKTSWGAGDLSPFVCMI